MEKSNKPYPRPKPEHHPRRHDKSAERLNTRDKAFLRKIGALTLAVTTAVGVLTFGDKSEEIPAPVPQTEQPADDKPTLNDLLQQAETTITTISSKLFETADSTPFNSLKPEKHIPLETNKGAFKSFMDYQMITDPTSRQFQLQGQPQTFTNQQGLRCYNYQDCELPMVAVGTGVTDKIGKIVRVTFDNDGQQHTHHFIVGDFKANHDTDDQRHIEMKQDGSVVEFLIDKNVFYDQQSTATRIGDLSYYQDDNYNFQGNIKEIFIYPDDVLSNPPAQTPSATDPNPKMR